eukprot:gene35542-43098_t
MILNKLILATLALFGASVLFLSMHALHHHGESQSNRVGSILPSWLTNNAPTNNSRQSHHQPQATKLPDRSASRPKASNLPKYPAKVQPNIRFVHSDPVVESTHARRGQVVYAKPPSTPPANPSPGSEPKIDFTPKSDSNMTCTVSFPDKCPMYFYVKFWNKRFYPEDCYHSPLTDPNYHPKLPLDKQKFLVFQPDLGGWNNIRMAAETAIMLAHASGRTLVLPPMANWYLLWHGKNPDENKSTFAKFFDLSKIQEAVHMISMEEFLTHLAFKGKLKVPLNTTKSAAEYLKLPREKNLWKYMFSACYVERWEPGKQFIAFHLRYRNDSKPATPTSLSAYMDPHFDRNSPRFKEMKAHGRMLRPYNEQLHNELCLYFPGHNNNDYRLLTHFYTYLYWEDLHIANIYKRIVRDRMHYHDILFCAAGKIIELIHKEAALLMHPEDPASFMPSPQRADHRSGGGNVFDPKAVTYYAAHIRRGDFQYAETKLPAEEIWNNIRPLYNFNVTKLLYISTDEKDRKFFQPFVNDNGVVVRFFDDYVQQLPNFFEPNDGNGYSFKGTKLYVTKNHVGMLEQIICANAHTFVGTPLSTFTGYITRMRGYYRDGRYKNTFYTMKNYMYQLQKQRPLVGPFWAREFELSHRDIDDYFQP